MNPIQNQFGEYNEQRDITNLFRDYLLFCSDEQNTMNNILQTQNLISNNRYSIFNQLMRFARPEQNTPPTWNFPTFTNTIPNRTLHRSRRRPPRIFQFPMRRSTNTSTNTTINPLQQFINETMTDTTPIRRPLSLRSFFDNASVFNYTNDISYNQTRCPITMTDFSNNDLCIRLPCNHIFKYRPLLQWFTVNRTCPMCRSNISSINNSRSRNRNTNTVTHSASIQTTDISNGFIADISANSIEELTSALTSTVSNRLRNIFQNVDSSANNLAWATNISLDIPNRDNRQSPIILHNQLDISDNVV